MHMHSALCCVLAAACGALGDPSRYGFLTASYRRPGLHTIAEKTTKLPQKGWEQVGREDWHGQPHGFADSSGHCDGLWAASGAVIEHTDGRVEAYADRSDAALVCRPHPTPEIHFHQLSF